MSNRLNLKGSGGVITKKLFPETTIHEWFDTNSSFYVKKCTTEKIQFTSFHEIFTSADEILISGGGLSTRQ